MDAGDWIFLIQTIVLTLTGIVIFWYAWETQQLRKVTTRQAELVAEQLAMMRQSLQMHTDEQVRASKPFIRWRGGSSGPSNWTREFENDGGPIFSLSIRTDADIQASIRPHDLVQTGQQGTITVKARPGGNLPEEFTFSIAYRTRLDAQESKRFQVKSRGDPHEVEGTV